MQFAEHVLCPHCKNFTWIIFISSKNKPVYDSCNECGKEIEITYEIKVCKPWDWKD